MATTTGPDLSDIQGILMRGYTHHIYSCHLIFQFHSNKANASAFIGAIKDYVQSAADWGPHPPLSMLNVGLTFSGVLTLNPGFNSSVFDPQFVSGPTSSGSQSSLGDNGPSAVSNWTFGNSANPVDCVVHVYALTQADLDTLVTTVTTAASANSLGEIMPTTQGGRLYQVVLDDNPAYIHFNYHDGIDNPLVEQVNPPVTIGSKTYSNPADLNNFLVGYAEANQPYVPPAPTTSGPELTFATNGFYNAFRVLYQDVFTFEQVLQSNIANIPASVVATLQAAGVPSQEWIAAKMCGRWRDGSPLMLTPDVPNPSMEERTDFDYSNDVNGTTCPFAAHTRATNPRNYTQNSTQYPTQITAGNNPIPRLMRRGVPYGAAPANISQPDTIDRGLVGLFFCGSFSGQFEKIYGWLNSNDLLYSPPVGLAYPSPPEAMIANLPIGQSPTYTQFTIPMAAPAANVVLQLSQFVNTRGTAYLLMPSLSALQSCCPPAANPA